MAFEASPGETTKFGRKTNSYDSDNNIRMHAKTQMTIARRALIHALPPGAGGLALGGCATALDVTLAQPRPAPLALLGPGGQARPAAKLRPP